MKNAVVTKAGRGPAVHQVSQTGRRAGSHPADASLWDEADLARRVSRALDFAAQVIASLPTNGWPEVDDGESRTPLGTMYEKVVGETAMLLDCAASVQDIDEGLRERVDRLAALLIPLARSESMLAAVCADPGLASDRAVAHAVLSRLGRVDPLVDRLLAETHALRAPFGPERLSLRRLEQEWLGRVWPNGTGPPAERGLLGRSMLARRMDVLGSTRFEVRCLLVHPRHHVRH